MKVFFNESNDKPTKLIQSLSSVVDLHKKYHLCVVSCFLSDDVQDISMFIKDVTQAIRIQKFSLYIDSRQIIKIGVASLIELSNQVCRDCGEGWFEILAVDTPNLIHSKGYALLSEDETVGALVVSSSNFSKHGFFDQIGNYEAGLLTSDVGLVKDFLASIPRSYIKRLNELETFESISSFTFQYALIREGFFVCKWSGTIEQYFAVKYTLTKLGRQHIDSKEFQALGFSVDVDKISRQYLTFDSLSAGNAFPRLLSKGIETHLGHWIPKAQFENPDYKKKIKQFYDELSQGVQQQIFEYKSEIESHFDLLLSKGLILIGQSPISQVQEKLQQLESDYLKLLKFYSHFSVFVVPYNLTQTREIRELFEEIRDAHVFRVKKNDAMCRVEKAIQSRKPSLVNLF